MSAAGISLGASALALLATMALHPTGHDVLRGGGGKAAVSHSLALISVPLALYGFLILTRRLGGLALLAFITWAAGAMAVINAAVLSGFVAPAFIDDPTLLHYTGRLNQAFAGLYVMASSLAIVLWSVFILRQRISVWIGALGIVVGVLTIGVVGSGHLRLNVHGFGVVAIAQAIWMICVAVMLIRSAGGEATFLHT
ncbi:MAG TPA: hypothetical protein VKL19_17790 [Thermoanaerobaculia bacterium]|nr:hypothetical protein [Thermoanaerobaculia bacterium]